MSTLTKLQNPQIISLLQQLQASFYYLKIKTDGFRFNLVTTSFKEYHEFFTLTTDFLQEAIYETGERIRSIGGVANWSVSMITKNSIIKDEPSMIIATPQMVKALLPDYLALSDHLRNTFKACGNVADAGTIAHVTNCAKRVEHFHWELTVMNGKIS